jgi:hypothetical protein
MFVYLIRDGETSLHKIGRTGNLEKRLKRLNGNQSPNEKHIVFSIEVINAKPTEEILHNKYKKYNHRYEWFCLNDKQVENVIQDMNLMKNNEQILYSSNHEEENNDEGNYEGENNDDEVSDRVLELLAQIESLDLDVVELLELVERLSTIALRKLVEQEEEADSDDDEEYEDEDDEDQE